MALARRGFTFLTGMGFTARYVSSSIVEAFFDDADYVEGRNKNLSAAMETLADPETVPGSNGLRTCHAADCGRVDDLLTRVA